MTIEEIKEKINSQEYDFLRINEHLGNNIILLGLGGSYAYGTQKEDGSSDIDVRGITLNRSEEILLNKKFEQFTNEETDTTIYGLNKMITLLSDCNPNVIEMCGLRDEHYIFKNKIGEKLLKNKDMFLSKRCIKTFGGYASSMIYRAKQKESHEMSQKELEKHILKTIYNMEEHLHSKYTNYTEDEIKFYIDEAINSNYTDELYMDIRLTHYPVRDYCDLWNEIKNVIKGYSTIGKRNKHAIEHEKMGKHLMHLTRLYFMCIDILEKGEIITYREKEHDLLMDIRNGKYVNERNEILPEFYDILNELEKKFDYAKENTILPEKPNYDRINEFLYEVNRDVILNAG